MVHVWLVYINLPIMRSLHKILMYVLVCRHVQRGGARDAQAPAPFAPVLKVPFSEKCNTGLCPARSMSRRIDTTSLHISLNLLLPQLIISSIHVFIISLINCPIQS